MAGRNVGGWRGTEVTLVVQAADLGTIIEGLALARVHAAECLDGASSPRGAHAYDERLIKCMEHLALALGEKVADSPNSAKWRELLSDTIREYALAFWRGWNGG